MNCQFCGSQIPEGDQFCGQCGARTPVAAGSPPPASAPSPPDSLGQRDQQRMGQPRAAEPWRSQYFDRDPNAPAMAARYQYAGFWIRFGAWLLDNIFILLIALIPGIVLAVLFYMAVESGQEPAFTGAQQDENDQELGIAVFGGFALAWVPIWLIYTYIATSLGGGWGKRICNLRVVRGQDGDKPGFGTGALRVAVMLGIQIVSNVPVVGWIAWFLNYLWMIWDADKQTWHDKAAGTVVVRV